MRLAKAQVIPMLHRWMIHALAVFTLGVATEGVRADLVRDLAFGLGTSIQGNRNPLRGGLDLLATQIFVGNPLDFGPADLTLRGPISLAVTTGGRGLSQFDVRLSTSVDGDSAAVPLTYVLNAEVGGQSTQISGSLFLDMGISFSSFGFYDIELQYSSRQQVSSTGRFVNDDQEFDFDVGPINVSGNIFADILALLAEPLFEGAGVTNPFASFSGAASLAALLSENADSTLQRLASGDDLVEAERDGFIAFASSDPASSGKASTTASSKLFASATTAETPVIVPEPTVLVLMLLAIPAVTARRLRRTAR